MVHFNQRRSDFLLNSDSRIRLKNWILPAKEAIVLALHFLLQKLSILTKESLPCTLSVSLRFFDANSPASQKWATSAFLTIRLKGPNPCFPQETSRMTRTLHPVYLFLFHILPPLIPYFASSFVHGFFYDCFKLFFPCVISFECFAFSKFQTPFVTGFTHASYTWSQHCQPMHHAWRILLFRDIRAVLYYNMEIRSILSSICNHCKSYTSTTATGGVNLSSIALCINLLFPSHLTARPTCFLLFQPPFHLSHKSETLQTCFHSFLMLYSLQNFP